MLRTVRIAERAYQILRLNPLNKCKKHHRMRGSPQASGWEEWRTVACESGMLRLVRNSTD